MPPEIDLFASPRGSVTAPAGCGKTQLITDTLCLHQGPKPILILTHTNAGVSALRARLQRSRVPNTAYRLSTIDGFAIRLVTKFPQRSGCAPRHLELDNAREDYPAIRNSAGLLLQAGHVNEVLQATYSRLLVDEYQDCGIGQHVIVTWLATVIPTCVLGDPMQAIFGFRGNQLVNWQTDLEAFFPPIGQLATPWRWRGAGAEALGNWLLAARAQLQAGRPVDLRGAPPEVQWIPLTANAVEERRSAAQTTAPNRQGSVLIIGDARNSSSRYLVASQTPGAMAVEPADLTDLIHFCRQFDVTAPTALEGLVNFSAGLMTGVGAADLLKRVPIIRNGRNRTPPTPAEDAAVSFANAPSLPTAMALLNRFMDQPGTRVFRPDVLYGCLSALQNAAGGTCTLPMAATQIRERNRHVGRPLSKRAVGSTLLLKGLEADVAVILHPEQMTAANLYVALTRGAQRVVICSATPLLTPVAG